MWNSVGTLYLNTKMARRNEEERVKLEKETVECDGLMGLAKKTGLGQSNGSVSYVKLH